MGFSQLTGTSETPSPFLFLLSEVQAKHSVGSLLGHLKQSKEPPGLPWGQWLRIRLPAQGTQIQSLVWEDSTCLSAAKPKCHNC